MSEPIKKPNQTPESYSPTKPEVLNMAEERTDNREFIPVKGQTFSYRFDLVELDDSLKFAGAVNTGKKWSEIKTW